MLPSKLKRKGTEAKGKSNEVEKQEKESVIEAQSDYESDEVNFCCCYAMCFYLPSRLNLILGKLSR